MKQENGWLTFELKMKMYWHTTFNWWYGKNKTARKEFILPIPNDEKFLIDYLQKNEISPFQNLFVGPHFPKKSRRSTQQFCNYECGKNANFARRNRFCKLREFDKAEFEKFK
jgi:hypothetical protein